MEFRLISSALLLFLASSLGAQVSKLNVDLYAFWHDSLSYYGEGHRLAGVARVQPSALSLKNLEGEGLRIKYRVKDLWAVDFPLGLLPQLWEQPDLVQLEVSFALPHPLQEPPTDSALYVHNRLLPVYEGQAPWPWPLRGEGVIVGVIDDGFEWRHPDFLNPQDSSSRVLYLWDQTQHYPRWLNSDYGYGNVWTKAELDSGLCTHSPLAHGSHVAGIAMGNGWADGGRFRGIAPEAEGIWVRCASGTAFMAGFVDAVHYVLSQAAALGRPCAINSSLGVYTGSHDAQDLHAQLIEAMLEQAQGAALVQAGGNARQAEFHWGKRLQIGDTARVGFRPLANSPNYSIWSVFVDSADLPNLQWRLDLLNLNDRSLVLTGSSARFPQDFRALPATGLWERDDTLFLAGQLLRQRCLIGRYEGGYELRFEAWGRGAQDLWLWQLTGQGRADLWSAPEFTGTSAILAAEPLPAHYHLPDNQQTIVSSWPCSEQVITVGAYQNLSTMVNYAGFNVNLSTQGFPVPGIAHFSSLGPTRDGRLKPDLCASGGQVISAATLAELASFRASNYGFLEQGGWHVSNRGTSMAAPIVTGAVALYLQCKPDASVAELRQALKQTAYQDPHTSRFGPLPNTDWGYGKLDIAAFCATCLRSGCMDSLALNYDPLANLSDSSACWYLPSSHQATQPNAMRWTVLAGQGLRYENLPSGAGELRLFNALGQELGRFPLRDQAGFIALPPSPDGRIWQFFSPEPAQNTAGFLPPW